MIHRVEIQVRPYATRVEENFADSWDLVEYKNDHEISWITPSFVLDRLARSVITTFWSPLKVSEEVEVLGGSKGKIIREVFTPVNGLAHQPIVVIPVEPVSDCEISLARIFCLKGDSWREYGELQCSQSSEWFGTSFKLMATTVSPRPIVDLSKFDISKFKRHFESQPSLRSISLEINKILLNSESINTLKSYIERFMVLV